MADSTIKTSGKDQPSCCICQEDLLKNPVSCKCGQSFCSECVHDKLKSHSCPQCGETVIPTPVPRRKLSEVLDRTKKLERRSSRNRLDTTDAGPGHKQCNESTGGAVNSTPHTTESLKKEPENICLQHDKPTEFYCRTDHSCICISCVLSEHSGHDMVEAKIEKKEKQTEMAKNQKEVEKRIKGKQKELKELKQVLDTLKSSAQAAVEENEKIFSQLIHTIEKTRSEVTELIRAQEKMECGRVLQLYEQLEQEIAELHRRDSELQKMLNTDNDVYFLQNFQSLSLLPESVNSQSLTAIQHIKPDLVRKCLSDLKVEFQKFDKEEPKIISNVTNFQLTLAFEPASSKDFLEYFQKFTLDINTAHNELRISENNREARCRETIRPHIHHPDRFDFWPQVLCKESISGRSYWEVEWEKGIWGVHIAVSYKGVGRKGENRAHWFGHNSQSWSLECYPNPCIWHNNNKTEILGPLSSKIGVYVDHKAGILSFYDISDTMTLLHRVQTKFMHPLHPGFWFSSSSSIKLCDS